MVNSDQPNRIIDRIQIIGKRRVFVAVTRVLTVGCLKFLIRSRIEFRLGIVAGFEAERRPNGIFVGRCLFRLWMQVSRKREHTDSATVGRNGP